MTASLASFQARFPEFAAYPNEQVKALIVEAGMQLNSNLFGDAWDLAQMLYVAHQLVLSERNKRAVGANNGIPGEVYGPVSSKAVGPISKSMAVGLALDQGAGIYNSTMYGQQLYRLMKAGSGGPMYFPGRRNFGRVWPDTGFGNIVRGRRW